MSRIGKLPVAVPAGVKISAAQHVISVEGPKGKLTQDYNDLVTIDVNDSEVCVSRNDDTAYTAVLSAIWLSV